MSVGIFVEDRKSGRDAIREAARKVFSSRNVRQSVEMRCAPRGDMFSAEKMRAYVMALCAQHRTLAKVVICVDSECTDPVRIRAKVVPVERQLSEYGLGATIRYVVVVHAVEGWLAADADAVARVVGADVSSQLPPNLEGVCKPAELLSEIFDKNGRDFQKTRHDPRIAEHVDLAEVVKRNRSFQWFQDAILDP